MKKLAKLKLRNVSVLDAPQMQALKGGRASKNCSVRCNQDYQGGSSVPDCDRATVEKHCGGNLSNAVCVCI